MIKLSTFYQQNVDNSVSNFIKLFLDDDEHGEYNGNDVLIREILLFRLSMAGKCSSVHGETDMNNIPNTER